jgi:hypothetical protein
VDSVRAGGDPDDEDFAPGEWREARCEAEVSSYIDSKRFEEDSGSESVSGSLLPCSVAGF